MEEVTEIYQDPLAFLRNLGLEFAVDNDVVRKVYEQQHTQKTEIHTNLKVKEISVQLGYEFNWLINSNLCLMKEW